MTLPTTVVFDLDGTLVDSSQDIASALNLSLNSLDYPQITLDDVKSRIGMGARALIEQTLAMFGDVRQVDAERLLCLFGQAYAAHIADASRPYDGTLDMLANLKNRGLQLGVCTNKPEQLARLLLEKLSMNHFFSAVTGGDTFAFRKPDPRHLLETISRLNGSAAHAVLVGDSHIDMETGAAAFVPTVAVSFGFTGTPPGAGVVIDHYRDMLSALQNAHQLR